MEGVEPPIGEQQLSRVYIFDTTLRDGEQSPGCSMTTSEKLEMATALVDLGVDILEAGFPIASDGDFEAVDAISRQFPWVQVAALARSCTLDVERAAEALRHAKRPRIHTFLATSDIHLKHKLRKSRQQVLDDAVAAVSLARNYTDDVEFSAEDATRTDIEYLEAICQAVVEAGARTVNLPDTVGFSVPSEYAELIGRIVRTLGDRAIVSVHCHDDLGLAVANSLAAIEAGARQIECTINGIGERAGNAALEEIVMAIKTRQERLPFETKIHTQNLFPASQTLTRFISFGPQPNKAIVGENAFAHEAGIHQDGYLKNPLTYEIVSPESVGVPETRLVLGKHSGRHALHKRAEDLGYQLSRSELDELYQRFTHAADNKKGLRNDEIALLIESIIGGHSREAERAVPVPAGH
ncbi:MAG: 2-isopropylmalate synthase [Acidobacteriaceae bacterium]|nr:2-isopropylmalate synthase [Acidobacteriaceae bacterium]MBV9503263.1 2-isopropylmalate synthase [Acidobacteriaceae bacterium]